ncbi:hypothetical protein JJL56_26935 [Azospirillum sp. YIM DDC1]|uniref:DUF3035 domain-containing protein n=1 Tax=Azospirillum aestuarii TaxID=2802052 RepID=A0ABS1I6F7_9PROT|nr:hypothetical protein [Azospirillum aestuarii]MBK3775782.1 hypothetical protein [Azospirillum brasilense]MBK4722494.1 hypothetical protein [Azospirillum aestuarii]TWA89991.1 hypothetical protein FBY14_105295 [Azospirillum brasilense]
METGIRRGVVAKAGRLGPALSVVVVLALSACSDRVLDTGLVGAVIGRDVPSDDSPVRGMSGQNREYPNLGTVPPRPTDLRTEAQRQQDLDRLAQDREAARNMLPTPMDAPPPPDITPGQPSAGKPASGKPN